MRSLLLTLCLLSPIGALAGVASAEDLAAGYLDARWSTSPARVSAALGHELIPAPARLRFRPAPRASFLYYEDLYGGAQATFSLRFEPDLAGEPSWVALQIRSPSMSFEGATRVAQGLSVRCGEPLRTAHEVPVAEEVIRTDRWEWASCATWLQWSEEPGEGATIRLTRPAGH